jgi:hypothetical protein
VEVCLIRKPNILELYHIYSEPIQQMPFFDVCFELSFCMDTNSNHFSISVAPIVWISLVVLRPSLLICSATLTLWQCQCSQCSPENHRGRPATFPLKHWTIIIKLIIKFMNCFEWRRPSRLKMGMTPPLCDHSTSCFSKEQHYFYAFWINLHDLLCYHVTKYRSLNGWIINAVTYRPIDRQRLENTFSGDRFMVNSPLLGNAYNNARQ